VSACVRVCLSVCLSVCLCASLSVFLSLCVTDSSQQVSAGGNIKDSSSAGPVPRSAWLREQLSSHEWSALVSVANHNGERHRRGNSARMRVRSA
jgi:hypothetical protein